LHFKRGSILLTLFLLLLIVRKKQLFVYLKIDNNHNFRIIFGEIFALI